MSLIKWELELEPGVKELRLTFDKVVELSTDSKRDMVVIRVLMTGTKISEAEQGIINGKINARDG